MCSTDNCNLIIKYVSERSNVQSLFLTLYQTDDNKTNNLTLKWEND